MSEETGNVRITSTRLGVEDHGIFDFNLTLEGQGWGQGFGGWSLDGWNKEKKIREGAIGAIPLLTAILRAAGVEAWEQLRGKHVRYRRGDNGLIVAIGHIVDDDKWVVPAEVFKLYGEGK